MTNPWDKLDGDRYRSRALPSAYASWGEYRRSTACCARAAPSCSPRPTW
jgi:hypothetical protein